MKRREFFLKTSLMAAAPLAPRPKTRRRRGTERRGRDGREAEA